MFARTVFALFCVTHLVASQSCNTGAFYSAKFNRCYQYMTAAATFEFAEEQCIQLGGHLASIANGEENALINANGQAVFTSKNVYSYWIGASDLAYKGTWRWSDDKPFGYMNWALGQPVAGYNCAVQNTSTGYWSAEYCATLKPYVCASAPIPATTCPPQTTPLPTTCPTPKPCPNKTCEPSCDSGWTYFLETDSCYRVYHNKKWADAEATCVLLNAHLTSIHSITENTFVNNLAACGIKEGKLYDLAWIGMHKVNQDWVWTDGTKSDYFNWAPKQPDNPNKEFCVQTAPDLSHDKWYENWNNYVCNDEMRAFICKKASYHH